MKKRFSSRTQIFIIAGVIATTVFILVSGMLTLYSLNRANEEIEASIQVVDISRDVQRDMEKQFYTWKNMILGDGSFAEYQDNYHKFSWHSTHVQDKLFNMKLLCTDQDPLPSEINSLIIEHKAITQQYIDLLSELEKSRFRDRKRILKESQGKDKYILGRIDSIVLNVEKTAGTQIRNIRDNYTGRVMIALILITVTTISMGVFMARKLSSIQADLEKRVKERTVELRRAKEETEEANRIIGLSEKKYRLLVEGSKDIIFSLDEKYNFITANRAVYDNFKIKPDAIIGRNFIDLVYDNYAGDNTVRLTVKEKLDQLPGTMDSITFNAPFKSPLIIEPKELRVRLEYINNEGRNEIIGKGSPLSQDHLVRFFKSEKCLYELKNSLILADDITHRIIRNLVKFLDKAEIDLIRIALREIIINAMEHGNLNVSFEEKPRAMTDDTYFKFIEERQNDPRYGRKKVTVESSISPERIVYIVSDEGAGFDHEKLFGKNMAEINDAMIAHGRGIQMTRNIFDRVIYNQKGNKVMLMKYIAAQPAAT